MLQHCRTVKCSSFPQISHVYHKGVHTITHGKSTLDGYDIIAKVKPPNNTYVSLYSTLYCTVHVANLVTVSFCHNKNDPPQVLRKNSIPFQASHISTSNATVKLFLLTEQ